MISVFLSTWFNLALVVMLSNTNYKKTILSFIPLEGHYADFIPEWYFESGQLIVRSL
jgi:hypothetical protein